MWLEAETETEFSGEGPRDDGAAWIDVTDGRTEAGALHVALVIVTEVGVVRQVEHLAQEFQSRLLTKSDYFVDPSIKLEER